MAETHQEVVKVWIAPGCIVCDACEADCPEVFDVQEETCVIRPEATNEAFTRPLTPSIITAAEGCPVDVIKFETVEVEGPEPWAGQEEEAAAAAPAGGGAAPAPAKKKAAVEIPEGPPDPKWATLLATAHTSGSRSAGGPAVSMTPAKATGLTATERLPARAPAYAIAQALPTDAPPDALGAAMIGTGYTRPKPGLADRIRQSGAALKSGAAMTRRQFSAALLVGWAALSGVALTAGAALQSFMVPKLTKEPPSSFRAGKLADYPSPGVYEQFKDSQNVWIVRMADGTLMALSTICTHLGCIPNWLAGDQKFKCPCHGSGFYMTGINFEGPAPRPLERHMITLEGDTLIIDKSRKYRQELGQWSDPNSFVSV